MEVGSETTPVSGHLGRLSTNVISGVPSLVMATPGEGDRNLMDPWVVLKADSGDVIVHAMCVPSGAVHDFPKKGECGRGNARAVVEVIHRSQAPTESPTSEWRAWIAWRAHARTVKLDIASICGNCGQVIRDVAVNPDGLILIAH